MFIQRLWRNNKVFCKFLFSYLLILIFLLTVGIIAYHKVLKLVEADARNRNYSMLEQSVEVIDRQLSQIEKMTQQIAINSELNDMIQVTQPVKPSDNLKFKNLIDNILQYGIDKDFILSFYIYLKNSDYIINSESLYESQLFYKRNFKYDDMNYEEWKEKILNKEFNGAYLPSQKVTLLSNQNYLARNLSAITYVRSIPMEYLSKPEGNIVVLIDENVFQNLLDRITVRDGGWAYIADESGKIITYSSSDNQAVDFIQLDSAIPSGYIEKNINGRDMILTYITSKYNKWIYVAAVPTSVVLAKAEDIKKTTVTVVLIGLLLSLIIAFFLSYQNTKPITTIVKMIREFTGGENENKSNDFDYLRGNVSYLIRSNISMKETMERQLPIVRQAFYERLFKGEFSNLNELNAVLSYIGLEVDGYRFLVMIMHMFDYDIAVNRDIVQELDVAKVFFKETINKYINGKGLIYDIDEKKLAILVFFNTANEEECMKNANYIANGIYDELKKLYNIKVSFAGGSLCESLLEVSRSFEEAKQVINYDAENNDVVVWYRNVLKQLKVYFYPSDTESRLLNYIKAGDYLKAETEMNKIYHENIFNRKLPEYMLQNLSYHMRGTVIRLMSSMELEEDLRKSIDSINCTKPFQEVYENILNIYNSICYQVNEKKENRDNHLIQQIQEYIDNSYMDSEISLTAVASKFGLTEGYLSHFFKEQTGENFITYIENLRMLQACELLTRTALPVNEIAQKIGYNSAPAFRRAFKRAKGVNPNSYRTGML